MTVIPRAFVQWRRVPLDGLLTAMALALLLVAAERWRRAAARAIPIGYAELPFVPPVPEPSDRTLLARAAETAASSNPFRLARRMATQRYEPQPLGAAPPPPQPPALRPTFVLKAIIGGPPWQAVIDGIPGLTGGVVRMGDVFDKLVVRRITRDSVVVQGPDTTWTLTLSRE